MRVIIELSNIWRGERMTLVSLASLSLSTKYKTIATSPLTIKKVKENNKTALRLSLSKIPRKKIRITENARINPNPPIWVIAVKKKKREAAK